MSEIKVSVFKRADRGDVYFMQYTDPETRKKVRRRVLVEGKNGKLKPTKMKKEAMKAAGTWEAELRQNWCVLPSVNGSSVIYFVEAVGLDKVKIGISQAPEFRLKGGETWCPVPLRALGFLLGNSATEQHLHDMFRDLHIKGEWYYLAEPIRRFIEKQAVRPKTADWRDVACDLEVAAARNRNLEAANNQGASWASR